MSSPVSDVASILQSGVLSVYPSASLCVGRQPDPQQLIVGSAQRDTWFDIASLTKALATTLLVMKLCDEGRLQLDEEVLAGVQVAHLLSHSSGLPACFPPLWADQQGLLVAPSLRTREFVTSQVMQTPRAPAGLRSVYSDLGFIVLGQLVEQRGDGRLDEQLLRWLGPLGLAIGFRPLDVASPVSANLCAPTRRESPLREPLQGIVHDDTARAMLGVAGHAGLFAQTESVYRLGQALLDCYHDVSSVPRAVLGLRSATVRRFFQAPALPGLRSTWGLGFDHPDPVLPGASPSSAGSLWSRRGVGHLGFTGCSIWIDPDSRLVAVFLSNRVDVETPAQAEQTKAALRVLRPILYDAIVTSMTG
jgi:CubicO group peptidase (beta-lactamase class C family)